MAMIVGLKPLAGDYAVSRLARDTALPTWADGTGFVAIARTEDELSVVCLAERVPAGVKSDGPWRVLKFLGPFAFDETGIAAAVLQPLAQAAIGIFLVSTFDTDYLLVKAADFERSLQTLVTAGHRIEA